MNRDPLFVCNPKVPCPVCNGDRDRFKRKNCPHCNASGYMPVNLNGLWYPSPGFLVCGGPSVKAVDYLRLRERGICSLGVNQVSALVPVSAWCFGDPAEKFHHGLHLDPKTLTFAPLGKLRHPINVKLPDGNWRKTETCLRDCPGTLGFSRDSLFDPPNFFTTTWAHWGGKSPSDSDDKKSYVLATMMLGVRLLHYLGCPRVYLLGVDLWMTDDQPYAFTQTKKARNGRYECENRMMREIKPACDAEGFQIFNCNPESKCDVYPHVPFEQALEDCRGAVPIEPLDTAGWYEKHIAEQQVAANPTPVSIAEVAEAQRAARNSKP